jgi:O-antigen/teichoic acid export membrane protein
MAVVLYLSRLVDAGFDLGLGIRETAAPRYDLVDLVPTILLLRLAIAAPLIGIAWAAALLRPSEERLVIALYALTLMPAALSVRWALIGLGRPRIAGVARAVGELVVLLSVLATVVNRDQLWRTPIAQFAGDTVAAALLLVVLGRVGYRLRIRWRGAVARALLRNVVPYVGSTILGLALFNADLLFLRFFRDPATVGLYAAAYALVSFVINLGDMYALALIPSLSRRDDGGSARADLYAGAWVRSAAVTLPIAVGGAFVAEPLLRVFFGDAFAPARWALILLIGSAPLSVFRSVATAALIAHHEEPFILRAVALSAAINVTLNLIMVPRFGMIGAAAVTLATEFVRLTIYQARVRRLGLVAPNPVRVWKPALASALMAILLTTRVGESIWTAVPLAALAYGGAMVALGAVRRERGAFLRLTM